MMYGITYEMTKAYKTAGKPVNNVLVYIVPIIMFIFSAFVNRNDTFSFAFIGIILFLILYVILLVIEEAIELAIKRKKQETEGVKLFDKTVNTLSIVAYPQLVFSFMFLLNHSSYSIGYIGIILSFAIAMLTDTCAFMFGCAFGKHKLIPEVSPNKTIEGAIGGLVGGLVGALACFFIFYYTSWLGLSEIASFGKGIGFFILIGIVGSISTQVGDLIESAFKRKMGVKDLGKIFPGHGGFMDRVDGLMFTSVVVYVLINLLSIV